MILTAAFFVMVISSAVVATGMVEFNNHDTGSGKLRLKYFDAKGAAELSRILMHIGGLEFEDHRYPLTPKAGGGFEMTEFTAAREKGLLHINMDRVPILELEDGTTTLGQSRAIERYISRRCGMMGRNESEAALIDCIAENVRDIKDKWGKIRMTGRRISKVLCIICCAALTHTTMLYRWLWQQP